METISLSAQPRKIIGKKVKKLRTEGFIPAVLYGRNFNNQNLSIRKNEFEQVFHKAGTSSLVDLQIDNEEPIKILFHEPSLHPVTGNILHVDFYKVKMTEKITTEIPLKFIGESAAVNDLDGNLITSKDHLEVECLPKDLVPEIEVNISKLKTFDDTITIQDISIPEGIEILAEAEEIIASVTPPRSEEELEAELAEPAAEEEKEQIEKIEAEAEKEEKEGETAEVAENEKKVEEK